MKSTKAPPRAASISGSAVSITFATYPEDAGSGIHFGNKIEVVEEPGGTVLMWGFGGSTTLTVEDDALVMRADAEDAETLDRVKDVTGRHLERFGEKDGLAVTWQ